MKSRKIPTFIIIGVQKGGTTSLYHYLIQHPQILPAARKEIHFFDLNFEKGSNWYLKQFPAIADGKYFITGEASPYYIFHPYVPQRLLDLFPDIKLIVLLRNPVDRAISHYYHYQRKGLIKLTFAEAIIQEKNHLATALEELKFYPNSYSTFHRTYSFVSRGIYLEQLQHWFNFFSKNQFLILKSEDLFANPSDVVSLVFKFLELPDYKLPEYPQYKPGNYTSIDPLTKFELLDYFRPYNFQLEKYLGRTFNWNADDCKISISTKQELSYSKLKKVKKDLEQSRQQLTSIQSRLKALSQLSTEAQTTNYQSIPDLAFITCVEAGYLEAQSLLLYESIRRYGGCFSQYPIYAFSPRAGHAPSSHTRQRLEELSVEYIDKVLNSELDFFAMANKSFACAYIEENKNHKILVWLDSDTLLLKEPSKFWLPDYMDVAVRPIDKKRNTTSGANDSFDDYWQKLCQECDVDYNGIPFIETFVDRYIIKACYNGGLVVARAEKGIFRKWSENLRRGIHFGFDPRINRKWHSDQPALSLAIWGTTERVQVLPPTYNYPIQAIDQEPKGPAVCSSTPLVHIHYHQMFTSRHIAKNPLFQPGFEMAAHQKEWLLQQLPLPDKPIKSIF